MGDRTVGRAKKVYVSRALGLFSVSAKLGAFCVGIRRFSRRKKRENP